MGEDEDKGLDFLDIQKELEEIEKQKAILI